jgi:hypothetical protein
MVMLLSSIMRHGVTAQPYADWARVGQNLGGVLPLPADKS